MAKRTTERVEDAAVRGYLERFGATTVKDLRANLENRFSESAIRSALRRVGAQAREFGNWPRGKHECKGGGFEYDTKPNRFEAFALTWRTAFSEPHMAAAGAM